MAHRDPAWMLVDNNNISTISLPANTADFQEKSVEKDVESIENNLKQEIVKKLANDLYVRLAKTEDSTELHLIKLEAQLYAKMLQDLIESEDNVSCITTCTNISGMLYIQPQDLMPNINYNV